MPQQNIWVFYDRRTNPARVHRFATNGEPSAVVVDILRDPQVDSQANDNHVQHVPLLGGGNSPAVTRLPEDWQTAEWHIGNVPHGYLYVRENEYADPHWVLAEAERKRIAVMQSGAEPLAVDPTAAEPGGVNAPAGLPPQTTAPAPAEQPDKEPEFDPADTNQDGVVSKKERKRHEREQRERE